MSDRVDSLGATEASDQVPVTLMEPKLGFPAQFDEICRETGETLSSLPTDRRGVTTVKVHIDLVAEMARAVPSSESECLRVAQGRVMRGRDWIDVAPQNAELMAGLAAAEAFGPLAWRP